VSLSKAGVSERVRPTLRRMVWLSAIILSNRPCLTTVTVCCAVSVTLAPLCVSSIAYLKYAQKIRVLWWRTDCSTEILNYVVNYSLL